MAWCAGGLFTLAGAQGVAQVGGSAPDRPVGPPQRSVAEWLVRLQQAAQLPSYMGTFVVSSASGAMSSSRIWHVCEGDVQIERVFENMAAVAEEAGGSLEDIVKINVYLTDLANFIKFNEIMARYVPEPYPARAVVGVAALPRGALVEADAVLELSK